MALNATIHSFEIQLADVDRGVYETLDLRIARHPSETAEYLLTRVIAYCLEYREGIVFSRGLAEPDEPAIMVRDLTGAIEAWIEIGAPDAARLHRASKRAPRVAVYTHRPPSVLQRQLRGERIHRVEALELFAIDQSLLEALVEALDRRNRWELSISGRELYISTPVATASGPVRLFSVE